MLKGVYDHKTEASLAEIRKHLAFLRDEQLRILNYSIPTYYIDDRPGSHVSIGTPVATEAGTQSQEVRMREGITIAGVWYTRKEIEAAYHDLQQPEFLPGDRVRYKIPHPVNKEFIVVHKTVRRAHEKEWGAHKGVALLGLTDGNSYSPNAEYIEHVPGVVR